MVKVYMHEDLILDLGEQEAAALKKDFQDYKDGKGLPNTFGRDVPYNLSHNRSVLELQHLHFKSEGFPLHIVQFRRTSGFVLVYCPGFYDKNTFLLIAIIKHWSHTSAKDVAGTDKDTDLMAGLEAIAERFRRRF